MSVTKAPEGTIFMLTIEPVTFNDAIEFRYGDELEPLIKDVAGDLLRNLKYTIQLRAFANMPQWERKRFES